MNFKPKHCLMFLFIFMVMNNLITAEEVTIKTCASELELDTCYLQSTTREGSVKTVTEYYGKCKAHEMCVRVGDDDELAYQCMKVKYLLNQDEDCIVNEECKSGICKDKKCSYIKDGAVCDNSGQCAKGSHCSYLASSEGNSITVCLKYALENEACGDDGLECLSYLTCGTDNKCIKKYSLEDGTKTVEPEACKSGMAQTFNDEYICVSEFTVEDGCPNDQECVITYTYNGMTAKEEFECTYKNDGITKICDYEKGTPEMNEYIELYREKLEDLDDEELKEIEDYETLDSSKIAKALYKAELRAETFGVEECVVDFYMAQASQGLIGLKKILLIGLIALLL